MIILRKRYARQRTAVVDYLRSHGEGYGADMWQGIRPRMSSGRLYVILAELARDGVVVKERRHAQYMTRTVYRLAS